MAWLNIFLAALYVIAFALCYGVCFPLAYELWFDGVWICSRLTLTDLTLGLVDFLPPDFITYAMMEELFTFFVDLA